MPRKRVSDFANWQAVGACVGDVFEHVGEKVFGATIVQRRHFLAGDIHPDLECEKLDAWIEVKATQETRPFKIFLRQLDKYRAMVRGDTFPYSRVLFAFFSHSLFDITRNYLTRTKLAPALVRHTERIVVLDLSVVDAVSHTLPICDYRSCGYPLFRAWQHVINREFLENPQKKLRGLSLDPFGYSISRSEKLVRFGDARKNVPIVFVIEKKNKRRRK